MTRVIKKPLRCCANNSTPNRAPATAGSGTSSGTRTRCGSTDFTWASRFTPSMRKLFNEPADFDDVAKQIRLADEHTYDPATGLFYHGWDESKSQPWANPATGSSSNFWGRAIGWYAMALVDTLDFSRQTIRRGRKSSPRSRNFARAWPNIRTRRPGFGGR